MTSDTSETAYAAIKDSIGDSLTQLGRGSGITPEQRANMVTVIAHPLAFIVEEAIHEAIEPVLARAEAAERLNGELVAALQRIATDIHDDVADLGVIERVAVDALTRIESASAEEGTQP